MEKRRLGRTGLMVTAVGFGALPMQRNTMEEAGIVLNKALDEGINFIDTARAYTDSEEKIGRNIAHRRSEFYLASKSMARTKTEMLKDIDESLKQMRTDSIDLYQVHNIRYQEEVATILGPGGAYEALCAAREAGKIRFIGITGHRADVIYRAVVTGHFDTVQVPFNAVERDALQELFPTAWRMDLGTIVMKPLGGGQLTHTDLALRFILEYPVSTVIPGMDEPAHITQNIAPARRFVPLDAYERQILEGEVAEIGKNFCRRCGYCLPCPIGIDIPLIFIFYLQYTRYGMTKAIPVRYQQSVKVKAGECQQCGQCEQKCPYGIPIRARLQEVSRHLDAKS